MPKLTRATWFAIFGLSLFFPGLLIFASTLMGPHFPDWYCGTLCLSFPVCFTIGMIALLRGLASDA